VGLRNRSCFALSWGAIDAKKISGGLNAHRAGAVPPSTMTQTMTQPSPDDLCPRLRRIYDAILDAHANGADRILLTANPGNGAIAVSRRVAAALDGSTPAARHGRAVTRLAGLQGPAVNECNAPAPFRAPHHTVSVAGLIGGGPVHDMPRPGEVSQAGHGPTRRARRL